MRLGIISNPVSQHNHRFPPTHWRLARLLKKMDDSVRTSDKSEIPGALKMLLFDREINVLGVNGGDGTIHAVVNSLNRMAEKGELAGRDLPAMLFMNGGTYNMAARALGTKDDPVGCVKKFLRMFGDKPDHAVPFRELKILKIEFEGESNSDYGMIFGTEVIANALELCDSLGSGYLGLLRLLFQGSAGYFLKSGFYRDNIWRLMPAHGISVDGETLENCAGVVATTVDLMLLKGFIKSATV
ncbi:MAG: hypothetical protein FJ088_16335, partial [Deltaproteobacteria bacterium]|nr:hypothetical protein [Deltaproteobacteria bacterium]